MSPAAMIRATGRQHTLILDLEKENDDNWQYH